MTCSTLDPPSLAIRFVRFVGFLFLLPLSAAPTILHLHPDQPRQSLHGMGCGAMFYEAHITSLAARHKDALQQQLYDAIFKDVRTDFLSLMIRHDHEPENDNADPFHPQFDPQHFAYAGHTAAICHAARARNPKIRIIGTLYTPPPWMKTNNAVTAGGKQRASINPGMELELAEFCWAFLAWMHRQGLPVEFLCIANEPDWPHDQPGYCLTADQHAKLISQVASYLDQMARRFPAVPRPQLVGPNTLSAVDCAKHWLPAADHHDPNAIDVVGTHDYDRRGERFVPLRKLAGRRPLWVTEWCVNGRDESPGLLRSASEFWLAMSEAFNQGANAWHAYDWVYPPRPGGEALVHVDWGNGFVLTKIYHGFRQWCDPLAPGMRIVASDLSGPGASGISQPGVKAAAFVADDGTRLVAHVANVHDHEAALVIHPGPRFAAAPATRHRTSATEDAARLPDLAPADLATPIPLPPRSLNSFEWLIR